MKRIPRKTFTEEFKRDDQVTQDLSLKTWMDLQAKGELKSSLGADKLSAEQRRIRAVRFTEHCQKWLPNMEYRQSHRSPKTRRFTFGHPYQSSA